MIKGRGLLIILLGVSLFLRCDTIEYEMPAGYEWMTRKGHLFIKAGKPPRYLRVSENQKWDKHSWVEHDKEKPDDVEIVPLDDEIKELIVETMNYLRAKVFLGAYFDPEKATEFGVSPPAAQMSKVFEYNEDIASGAERYIQHFIFDHYQYNSFYPHVPLGENLYQESIPMEHFKTLEKDSIVNFKSLNQTDVVMTAFTEWFDLELPFYKHFEPLHIELLDAMLDSIYKEPIINDDTLSEEDKEAELDKVQYGHYTAVAVNNVHSVGCALTRRKRLVSEEIESDEYEDSHYFACNFGGGITQNGAPLYAMDENFLEQHGISKSQYDPSPFEEKYLE